MLFKRLHPTLLALAAGTLLALSGCGGSGGSGVVDPTVILVNACKDGPVAFFFNDEAKGGAVAYKTTSALLTIEHFSAEEGATDMALEEPDRSVQYDLQAHVFDPDTTAFCIAIGQKNPADIEEGLAKFKRLRSVIFPPDRTAPIGNRARLWVIHGFNRKTNFYTPKIVLQNAGDNPQFKSADLPYGNLTVMEVDSGDYVGDNRWIVKDAEADGIYIEKTTKTTFKPGGLYVALISGVEGETPAPSIEFIEVPAKD